MRLGDWNKHMSLRRVSTSACSCPQEAIPESGVVPRGHEETIENLCAQCPGWAGQRARSAVLLGEEELRDRLAELLHLAAADCGTSYRVRVESAVQMIETSMERTEDGRHIILRDEDWQALRRAAGLE